MRAIRNLHSYTNKVVTTLLYTWIPRALMITTLTSFIILQHCVRAYLTYQYKEMIKNKGSKFIYGRRRGLFSRFSKAKAAEAEAEELECSICLCEFVEGEVGRELEGCKHKFHATCVDKWLLHGETAPHAAGCPLCRRPVVSPAEEAAAGGIWKEENRDGAFCFEVELAPVLLHGLPNSCRVPADS